MRSSHPALQNVFGALLLFYIYLFLNFDSICNGIVCYAIRLSRFHCERRPANNNQLFQITRQKRSFAKEASKFSALKRFNSIKLNIEKHFSLEVMGDWVSSEQNERTNLFPENLGSMMGNFCGNIFIFTCKCIQPRKLGRGQKNENQPEYQRMLLKKSHLNVFFDMILTDKVALSGLTHYRGCSQSITSQKRLPRELKGQFQDNCAKERVVLIVFGLL